MTKEIKYIQRKDVDFSLLRNLLDDSIKLNQFTNGGPSKLALERKLENLLSIDKDKAVLCTSNGTLALHALYLHFLNNKKFKFLSPSFTFPSCSVGMFRTKMIDIDLDTYTMPLNDDILKEYDVFIVTNLFGTYPPNLIEWSEKCKKFGKILVLDNASSPTSSINGVNICNIGDFSFGSLHHTKYLGFGEGGFMVVPRAMYCHFEKILGFGFERGSKIREYSHYSSNFKMSDVSASFILQWISRYSLDTHLEVQKYFLNQVSNIQEICEFNYSEGVVYGNMPILYNKEISIDLFRENGVEAQKYYYPLQDHKNSQKLFSRIINLPLHENLTKKDIDYMINVIKRSLS